MAITMHGLMWASLMAAMACTPAFAQQHGQGFGGEQQLIAGSGVKTRITQHVAVNASCEAERLNVALSSPPQHGKVFIQHAIVTIPQHNGNGGAERCAGSHVEGVVIYYQSERGYKGDDSFSYSRLNADNAADRHNGTVTRTVTVE